MKSREDYLCAKPRIFILLLMLSLSIALLINYAYIPALPVIARSLSSTNSETVLTVTALFIGYGLSQLWFAPFSDSFGRRVALFTGIGILLIGLLIAITTSSIEQLIAARFIQGLGIGSVSVLYRVMIRDYFSEESLGQAVSIIITFACLFPPIAPFLGGMLLEIVSWKILFLILFFYALIGIIILKLYLPETIKKENYKKLQLISVSKSYLILFRNKQFLMSTCSIIFSYGCLTIYIAVTPFIYQINFHLSPAIYGTFIIIPSLFFAAGSKISSFFNKKGIEFKRIVIIGFIIIISSSLLVLFSGALDIDNKWVLTLLISIEAVGIALVYINATAEMLRSLTKAHSPGIALSGTLQMLGSGLIIYIASFMHIDTVYALGISTVICGITGFLFSFTFNINK
ncbi:MAG TPA: MFS transporter [Victivallales bacterium]|nr:MFS transporter [Victivallales bacterium]